VQILPSLEYAPLAQRWTGNWSGPFEQRIPYAVTGELVHMTPRAIFAFLFGKAPDGGAEYGPYFGIMPLLLTVVGVRANWSRRWVKYFTVLGVAAFVYTIGEYSFLHGLAYALIPFLDKLWEAGRFIYLTHFAMALLAGFGMQSLLVDNPAAAAFYQRLLRLLGWIVAVVALAVGVPALLGTPQLNESSYLTLLLLLATWGVYYYVLRDNRRVLARFAVVAVILCDLYAFNLTIVNRAVEQKAGKDSLAEMLSLQPVAASLKSQPGLFRVAFDNDFSPRGMGDLYGIQTTRGTGVTMLTDYFNTMWAPSAQCLLNVRYMLGTGKDHSDTPVFSSGQWKVYENPSPCPRAWVVGQTVVEPADEVRRRVEHDTLDVQHVAYLSEPLASPLDSPSDEAAAAPAAITFGEYRPDRFELDADVSASSLLVLSEIYYPGWTATINGQPAHIYKVDNILRGLIVSPGSNHIVMEHRPRSVPLGAILSLTAFLGTFLFAAIVFFTRRRHP
jgi:Bacterial membrane protein YfhO